MKKSKYKLSDIKIDDNVFFSIRGTENHGRYWTVTALADDGKIKVKVDGKDLNEEMLINVGDIEILHSALEVETIKKK